jgi:hypothetical protein
MSYVRDDRYIDLETDTVFIESDSCGIFNSLNIYREGEFCYESLENAVYDFDSNCLYRRGLVISFGKDNKIHIGISIDNIVDFTNQRIGHIKNIKANDVCKSIANITGVEWFRDGLQKVSECFDNIESYDAIKLWFSVESWNLYGDLPIYSHLINTLYHTAKAEAENFWEAINIPEYILPCLATYYIGEGLSAYTLSKVCTGGRISVFLDLLSAEARNALIEAALNEKIDLFRIEKYENLLEIIRKDEEFFIEYLKNMSSVDDLVTAYVRDMKLLENANLDYRIDNIQVAKLMNGAEKLGMDPTQYETSKDLISNNDILWYFVEKCQ